jgi:hypothetical protein
LVECYKIANTSLTMKPDKNIKHRFRILKNFQISFVCLTNFKMTNIA